MTDYYLEDKARLEGQPKRTIADYVESEGILVPRRFDSLSEAKASRVSIICRSEHTQDYDGCSGLLQSPEIKDVEEECKRAVKDEKDLKRVLFTTKKDRYSNFTDHSHSLQYCKMLNLELKKFKSEVSHTFWELLDGYNQVVTADSAIPNRYFIETLRDKSGDNTMGFSIFENGKLINLLETHFPKNLKDSTPRIIELYEKIRHMPNFDVNHCPIMEFITTFDMKTYFLQYHRTLDFKQAQFTLDREPSAEEKEVFLVRGATPPEGIDAAITICDGWRLSSRYPKLKEKEDGSFDFHYWAIYSELMVHKRKVQINTEKTLKFKLLKLLIGHLSRSKFFKPEISIIDSDEGLFEDEEIEALYEKAKKTRQDQTLNYHITSDGRRAFIKRLD